MLLQHTSPRPPSNSLQGHHKLACFFSSQILNSLSFSSGLLRDPIFVLGHNLILPRKTHKNPVLITCSSASNVHNYGTYDYEKRPRRTWKGVYKEISMMPDPEGAASVLNHMENEGNKLTKWELTRIVKELRKFKKFKYALQVHEWMNNRPESYRITTSDAAIQLDLISKVHGIPSTEKFFESLPESSKDKRIYGSLLNAYARSKRRLKAETLMEEMRRRFFANHPLPFNVMMTLYARLEEHGKIESLVSEMREKNILLDIYTYNIWIASCGSRGFVGEMELVFARIEADPKINPNWATYGSMATAYIRLGDFEKAEGCLKKIESRFTGRDRLPYHYLITLYGNAGKKEDVYRIWEAYKNSFQVITNIGFHTIVSSLVRVEDIEGAERVYEEWFSAKTSFDARIGNLLLGAYVRRGLSEKAEAFFGRMVEGGGKPNAMTWEILAEDRVRKGEAAEAVSCLEKAAACEGSMKWRPKPGNVSEVLRICEERGDEKVREALMEILRKLGCVDDERYLSLVGLSAGDGEAVSVSGGGLGSSAVGDGDGDESPNALLDQLKESF